ncbi:hypothetical protein B1B04_08535 [Lysinibacillus sp. KCTC 33748]|uniref:hypothetical protein n=1 Tax=unclassified Lysinibacillus TaxID=2636778 RepID=UPI0009A84BAC|nr:MULTISPECIES: hypothetical protein [unclassified Lysinibacillus]OXS74925.1 hypothetical protein B1B04_08535 [Lysinibacillus sp. KCTC 33748]SKB60060.1 hypothetical protein SAMN06295926_104190 [Lysinibacillus sp. AC-3]
MSNERLQTLLDRMPRQYANSEDSNNYKLLKIIAENGVENIAIQQTILKYWDVEQAEDYGLDRLGKDEGIARGSWDDEEYRKMIKIQCVLNLSDGDIDTMNQIMDAYMGNDFIGFEEGWMEFDPATLLLNIRSSAKSVPESLTKRIKAAGVGIYIFLNELNEFIILHAGTYAWQINYKICGRFKTARTHGALGDEILSIHNESYGFIMNNKVCGRFKAGGVRN